MFSWPTLTFLPHVSSLTFDGANWNPVYRFLTTLKSSELALSKNSDYWSNMPCCVIPIRIDLINEKVELKFLLYNVSRMWSDTWRTWDGHQQLFAYFLERGGLPPGITVASVWDIVFINPRPIRKNRIPIIYTTLVMNMIFAHANVGIRSFLINIWWLIVSPVYRYLLYQVVTTGQVWQGMARGGGGGGSIEVEGAEVLHLKILTEGGRLFNLRLSNQKRLNNSLSDIITASST